MFPFAKNLPAARALVSWLCALSVLAATIFYGRALYETPPIPFFAPQTETEKIELTSAALEDYINKRVRSLDSPEKIAIAKGRGAERRSGYLNRPSIALRGTAVSGQNRVAAVAVDGVAKTVVVRQGDEIGGIRIVRIESAGVICEWRGETFFVPVL